MPRAFSYTRLSSEQQLQGQGARRQIDRAEAYAKEHGLQLDRTFDLADHGLSGFTGANVDRGALGRFIEAVRAGKIEKGSILLVESLDRLSRQKARQSLRQFLELLDAGITIKTLVDDRTYTEDSDHVDLQASLGIMARAHDESRTKSDRQLAAWNFKRKNASNKILTKCCPGWLKPKADRSGFDIIKSRVEVVQRIFADTIDHGMGVNSITRRLNREKVPTFGSARAWQMGYVHKILKSRTVLGEIASTSKGKSTEVVKGYYPAVVSDEDFYRAAAAIEKRRQGGGGRRGAVVSNLFAKVIFCGQCGHRMAMKGGRRGGRIFSCEGAQRGLGCTVASWRSERLEESFLRFVAEVDLASLSEVTAEQTERKSVEAEIGETEGRLVEVTRQRGRTFDLIMGDEATDFLKTKLRDLDGEVALLEKHLVGLREKLQSVSQENEAFARGKTEIAELIKRIQTDATFSIRSTLAARIRDLVKKIFLYPSPVRITIGVAGEVETVFAGQCFAVHFKNGTSRLVAPTDDDPACVVDTGSGRVVGGDATVREELVRRYNAEPGWEDVVLIEPAA